MFYTNDILKIFNNCCEFPITLINCNYNVIYTEGFKEDFKPIFSKFVEDSILTNIPFNDAPLTWNYEDNISYYIISQKIDEEIQYFLIGPYKTQVNSIKHPNVPLMDTTCLKYLYDLLMNIIKDYSSNKLATFSPNISRVIKHVEDNYSEPICVSSICKDFNMNKCYFCRLFKKETGITFIQYLNNFKIEKSKELLKNTNLSLLEVAFEVGFSNQSYFSTIFKKITGTTPLDYRNSFKN